MDVCRQSASRSDLPPRLTGVELLVVMGMAGGAGVIAVICDQMYRTTTYRTLSVKALVGAEWDE